MCSGMSDTVCHKRQQGRRATGLCTVTIGTRWMKGVNNTAKFTPMWKKPLLSGRQGTRWVQMYVDIMVKRKTIPLLEI